MWRSISRPASAIAVAVLVLAGCGKADQANSAGTVPTSAGVRPTASTTTPTAAPTTATTPTCADVVFSSTLDDKASDIKAFGLSCTDAETIVRKIGPQVSAADGPARVESDGVVCVRTSARSGDHGPPSSIFECTSGVTKVVFVRT